MALRREAPAGDGDTAVSDRPAVAGRRVPAAAARSVRRAGRAASGAVVGAGRHTGIFIWSHTSPGGRAALVYLEAIRKRCARDRILGMSAEAGFWQLVSLPSLLLAVFGAVGYLNGVIGPSGENHIRNDILRFAGDFLTASTVRTDVTPIVEDVLSHGHPATLSVTFLISLWSGSSGMADYVNTITVAYEMRGLRNALRTRALALGLYVAAVLAGAVLVPAAVLGPDALSSLAPSSAAHTVSIVVHAAYWPVLVVASIAALTTLYRVSLPRRVSWLRQLPGAVVAVAIWVGGSVLVRLYVAHKDRSVDYYGTLAAPLAVLVFFYLTALAVLLGAELNAERHLRLTGRHAPGSVGA